MTPSPISTEESWEVQVLHEHSKQWIEHMELHTRPIASKCKLSMEAQYPKSQFRIVRIVRQTFVEEEK